MEKICVLLIAVLFNVTTMAQDTLSVLGLKLGTDIETAHHYLEQRFGREHVSKEGGGLVVRECNVTTTLFDYACFIFGTRLENGKIVTKLGTVALQKALYNSKDALEFWDEWTEKLCAKYPKYDYYKEGEQTVLRLGTPPKVVSLILESYKLQGNPNVECYKASIFYVDGNYMNNPDDY